jgi:hypothetical protein
MVYNNNVEKAVISAQMLYNDIDECIDDLLNARLAKDKDKEGVALWKMEMLMSGSLQNLSYIIEHLSNINETF